MRKKWWLLGGCLALVALIIGTVGWSQNKPTYVKTSQAKHNRVTSNDVSATQISVKKAQPWKKLNHSLKLPILMYHSISSGNDLRVPKKQIVSELNYLKRHHYKTLTAAEATRALTTNTVPQKKVVWITLDDAYKDNQKILATLKKNHQHVTINAITGFTHKSNHLSLSEMKALKASGHVDFASHTVDHLDLTTLTTTQQRQELVNSKKWLDKQLNQTTKVLCYPSGQANTTTHKLAKQAGYSLALTTNEGFATMSEGLYNLSRLRISPGISTATFADLIQVSNS